MWLYLWIGFGGFLGANTRYLVQTWAAGRWGVTFPYGTMIANVSGCFLLTFFMTLIIDRFVVNPQVRLFIATGFLGGYTTFSSFGYETWHLFEVVGWQQASLNFLGNTVLGALAVLLAVGLARL